MPLDPGYDVWHTLNCTNILFDKTENLKNAD